MMLRIPKALVWFGLLFLFLEGVAIGVLLNFELSVRTREQQMESIRGRTSEEAKDETPER